MATDHSATQSRRSIAIELGIVGAVTFGTSAVSAMLSLAELITLGTLSSATVELNPSRSDVEAIDAARQMLSVVRLIAWGGLGWLLLRSSGISAKTVGLTRTITRRDAGFGLALAAVIGLPGLGIYLSGKALGLNAIVVASESGPWWQPPVLVLLAVGNAVAEEVLVVAYLLTRLRQLGLTARWSIAISALLRGSYHLYQGIGAGIGNVAMGVIFGAVWQRSNRLWPLIIAHAIIDAVVYLGYLAVVGR